MNYSTMWTSWTWSLHIDNSYLS